MPYSEFSDYKSSNRNPMDDFEILLIAISFLSENGATLGGRLAQFQYWSPLVYSIQFWIRLTSHIIFESFTNSITLNDWKRASKWFLSAVVVMYLVCLKSIYYQLLSYWVEINITLHITGLSNNSSAIINIFGSF